MTVACMSWHGHTMLSYRYISNHVAIPCLFYSILSAWHPVIWHASRELRIIYEPCGFFDMTMVPQQRLDLFTEMEKKYEERDTQYFVGLLDHDDYVIRTRATCILVDFGGEDKVQHIARVLKNDPDELVRHEAAFSLGQMCYSSGIAPLADATINDPSMFVRHEAAIALGVMGSNEARDILQKALSDKDRPVVKSAVIALSNIEFMEKLSKNAQFAKLTGG